MAAVAGGGEAAVASRNVFVYGSLLSDDVVQAVIQRVPSYSPASLHGFQRHSIKGRVYPAIIPSVGKKVDGRVLFDLTDNELEVLDEFEDSEYTRSLLEVALLGNEFEETKLKAFAYVWSDTNDRDLYEEWDFEGWKTNHKEEFVKMCDSFRADLKESKTTKRVDVYEAFFEG